MVQDAATRRDVGPTARRFFMCGWFVGALAKRDTTARRGQQETCKKTGNYCRN